MSTPARAIQWAERGAAPDAAIRFGIRRLLKERLAAASKTKRDYPLRMLFSIRALWLSTLIYFLIVMGVYGINFWLPAIVEESGVQSLLSIGWITAASPKTSS